MYENIFFECFNGDMGICGDNNIFEEILGNVENNCFES